MDDLNCIEDITSEYLQFLPQAKDVAKELFGTRNIAMKQRYFPPYDKKEIYIYIYIYIYTTSMGLISINPINVVSPSTDLRS